MWNNNGKLTWGATINTTENRVCDPQGQFNREEGEFEAVTYADVVELEATRARENNFVMTVPLDQLIELCTFNGDIDKIAGLLCNEDISEKACQIREDPPNCHLAPCEGVAALSRMARMPRRSSSTKL